VKKCKKFNQLWFKGCQNLLKNGILGDFEAPVLKKHDYIVDYQRSDIFSR
jgi:hypothetical protein